MDLPHLMPSVNNSLSQKMQSNATSWEQTWSRNLLHHQQQALVPWLSRMHRMHGIWTSKRIVRSAMEGLDCDQTWQPELCSAHPNSKHLRHLLQRRLSSRSLMVEIWWNHWNLRCSYPAQLSIIKALAEPTSTSSELFTTRISPLPQ